MSSSEATTRRRVKLYMLNEERQWDDKGTGHVSALYNDASCICLVVISENDGSPLLESKIQPETAYQKQQETLIVWSEGENVDLALSFQEKAGCDDIWEKICSVQGKDPSVEITQDVVDESDDTDDVEAYSLVTNQALQTFELPPCELSRLEEIAEVFSTHLNLIQKRERIVAAVDRSNYVRQLLDLFHKAEDLEDLNSLHFLYDIFRQLILFNKQVLYETLFSDDVILDVIGILEYNPGGRTRHRDFLRNQANFREALPLHNSKLINKIHQTYRVQYIQDCCLPPPSLVDEQSMSDLKSFISSNKMEILSALQEDREIMLRLFTCLKSPETSDSHRRELALFVKEFCNLSVQTDQKEAFLATLSAHGALSTVEVLLSNNDHDVKSAALVILQAFVENQPSIVREHVCKEGARQHRDENILINLMITQLLEDFDPELGDAYQLGYMLRILVDPDNMTNASARSEKSEFLSFFYKRCIGTLTKPLFDNTAHGAIGCDNYHSALVLSNVLDLLIFCIETHTHHMKNYCLHRDLVKRVLVLLRSTHKFLVLSALRLLRKMIQLKEEFYNRYLIKNCLFKPVVELFTANGHRYNMIDSAIVELFEYIHMEDITSLINYAVNEHWDVLNKITYVNTFKRLKERYDANNKPGRTDSSSIFGQTVPTGIPSLRATVNSRFVRGPAVFDDEEQWFNQDDEDEDETEISTQTQPHGQSSMTLESIPSRFFTTSSSPPAPSSPSGSPKALHHSPVQSTTAATTTPPFTLLLPSSSSTSDSSPGPLINRRIGHTSYPAISIHIRSTHLGVLSNTENENDANVSSPSRSALKRLFGRGEDDDAAASSGDGSSGGDESGDGDEEALSVKHSKRPLVEEHGDSNNNNSSSADASGTIPEKTRKEGEIVDESADIAKSPMVGLVDYSDEESDEEESNLGSTGAKSPPATSSATEEPKVAKSTGSSSS
ncbi:Serine/threonine-protein phosphatase 4 regulatory subunit 3 [Echinococcus granulosus]|nr:Serine/threonine-protein phosphatase 4 regulatory subunit 3 [Echinococcus granulosus]